MNKLKECRAQARVFLVLERRLSTSTSGGTDSRSTAPTASDIGINMATGRQHVATLLAGN